MCFLLLVSCNKSTRNESQNSALQISDKVNESEKTDIEIEKGKDRPRELQVYNMTRDEAGRVDSNEILPEDYSELMNYSSVVYTEKAGTKQKVVFMGDEYCGTYVRSEIYETPDSETDVYYDDVHNAEIAYNPQKKMLTYFILLKDEDSYSGEYPLEECKSLAYDMASQYVDITDYICENYSEGEGMFRFLFTKEVEGLKTDDWIMVGVTGKGEIISVSISCHSGCYDYDYLKQQSEFIERYKSSDTDDAIKDKITEIFGNSAYHENGRKLMMLPKGELGLIWYGEMEEQSKLLTLLIVFE